MSLSPRELLANVDAHVRESFVKDRTILAFDEYLSLCDRSPRAHLRDAARYLRDLFDHYGTHDVQTPLGRAVRFNLFDAPFQEGRERVVGQEDAQLAIYRQLGGFVQQGRVNRLVVLHGPNGSAKSSLANALVNAMEDYSRQEAGTLYRFNWVFPSEKRTRGHIGFDRPTTGGERAGGRSSGESAAAGATRDSGAGLGHGLASFAHLDGADLDARIRCDLKDHPLLLLPPRDRRAFIDGLRAAERLPRDFVVPAALLDGQLCHRCREIHDALLHSYGGDFQRVLAHVQVERFYVSRRYRRAAITIEPQLHVDARTRQLTADQSLMKLPPALAHVPLYEVQGELADANRGVVEFSDFLKRPIDAFKYLLSTMETQRASVGDVLAFFDLFYIGSANEAQLNAFKEFPDFASFKGRMSFVRVPYLLRWSVEREVYDARIDSTAVGKHVSPHSTHVAALWAVLTRMRKPRAEEFPRELRDVIASLTPLEKARLYERAEVPTRLTSKQAQMLRVELPRLHRESARRPIYEGSTGASAREMLALLLAAAQNPDFPCLSSQAVFAELERLVQDKSLHDFLREDRVDGYHDHEGFIDAVRNEWLDRVDEEARVSSGLVEETRHIELFERYVRNVSTWLKGDKLADPVTGQMHPADEQLMRTVESTIAHEKEDRREFRQAIVAKLAAQKIARPDDPIVLDELFPELVGRLTADFFKRRKEQLGRILEQALRVASDEGGEMAAEDLRQGQALLDGMRERHGYCGRCASEALGVLMRKRYRA